MTRLLHAIAILLIAFSAHARTYNQGELDALLAPVALYPDPLLGHVLNAAAFPQDVASAAAWRRDNPHHSADAALRDVEGYMWHPSVKALVAQPDLLSRMAESPEWLAALGEAYLGQPQQVQATVQQLRMRAQSTGALKSDEHQYVYPQGETLVVQPVYPNVVYAPYYNPYIVYGGWHWAGYRPAYFRPWVPCAVRVTYFKPVVPLRPIVTPLGPRPIVSPLRPMEPRPTFQQPARQASPSRAENRWQGSPQFSQSRREPMQSRQQVARMMPPPAIRATPYRAVPEALRAPVVQSHSNAYFRGNAGAGNSGNRGGGGGGRVRS